MQRLFAWLEVGHWWLFFWKRLLFDEDCAELLGGWAWDEAGNHVSAAFVPLELFVGLFLVWRSENVVRHLRIRLTRVLSLRRNVVPTYTAIV